MYGKVRAPTDKAILKAIGKGPTMFEMIRARTNTPEWDFRVLDNKLKKMRIEGLIVYKKLKADGGPGWFPA